MNPSNNNSSPNPVSAITTPAVGGGGLGTLIVMVAQSLPDSSPWKSWLVTLAPAVSVVVTSFWVWISAEIRKSNREKEVKKALAEMRQYLRQQINDPAISAKQRKDYEKRLSILEETSFQRELKKLIVDE